MRIVYSWWYLCQTGVFPVTKTILYITNAFIIFWVIRQIQLFKPFFPNYFDHFYFQRVNIARVHRVTTKKYAKDDFKNPVWNFIDVNYINLK